MLFKAKMLYTLGMHMPMEMLGDAIHLICSTESASNRSFGDTVALCLASWGDYFFESEESAIREAVKGAEDLAYKIFEIKWQEEGVMGLQQLYTARWADSSTERRKNIAQARAVLKE